MFLSNYELFFTHSVPTKYYQFLSDPVHQIEYKNHRVPWFFFLLIEIKLKNSYNFIDYFILKIYFLKQLNLIIKY